MPQPQKAPLFKDLIAFPVFVAAGLVFWTIAFFFVRWLGRAMEGVGATALLYTATLLGCVATAWGIRKFARPPNLVEAAAVICVTGLLMDGVLIATWPFLYGPDERVVRYAAAWRAFGAGALLLSAILLEHRRIDGRVKR